MSHIKVDCIKCKKDGFCVADCPFGILQQADKNSAPRPLADLEKYCVHCGHCVAVCPAGAISLDDMTAAVCPPVRIDLQASHNQLANLMRARRTVRVYRKKPVDPKSINQLLNLASYAPSGGNIQPVHWLVLYDTAKINRLAVIVAEWLEKVLTENPTLGRTLNMDRSLEMWNAGVDTICRGAPHLIMAHSDEQLRGPTACTIALSWLELAAPTLELGACWAGYFNAAAKVYSPMIEALGLPEGHTPQGAMMIGYPKRKYSRIPKRNAPSVVWR